MSESKKPIDQEINEWLEKQGYPLEMYVAQTFQDAWFRVAISEYYEDFETHEAREIDIIATRTLDGQHPVLIYIACQIECKSARSKPWVMFVSQAQPRTHPLGCIIGSPIVQRFLDEIRGTPLMDAIADLPLFQLPHLAYGVTQALKANQEKDVAYQAVIAAVKASVDHAQKTDRVYSPRFGTAAGCISLPIIVIDGLLFEGRIDAAGRVTTTQVDSGVVHWKSPNPSLATPFVYIVTRAALNDFIQRLDTTIEGLLDIVEQNMATFARIAQQRHIPDSAYKA